MSFLTGLFRLCYKVLFVLFSVLQACSWAAFGISKPDPIKNNGATAREMKIVYRHKSHELDNASAEDFVCTHSCFVRPDTLLNRTNVSLYTIEHDKVIFVECDPSVDLTAVHPFFYQAQWLHARKVYQLTHDDFEKLAEELAPSSAKKNLIMVYSTGRCGSTLLSQMFEKLNDVNDKQGQLISISEPESLTRLTGLAAKKHPRTNSLLKAALVFLFHGLGDREVQTLVIKPRAQVFQIATEIQREFPTTRPLFMYRDGMNYIISSLRSFQETGIFILLDLCLKYPILRKTILRPFWYIVQSFAVPKGYEKEYGSESFLASLPIPGYLALFYISIMSRYLEYKQCNQAQSSSSSKSDVDSFGKDEAQKSLSQMHAVRYQDLVSQPKEFCTSLFRVCGMIGSHGITEENFESKIKTVLEVMKKDSQTGTALFSSRENYQALTLSKTDTDFINDVFSRHPVINSPEHILPHTLLH